LIAELTTATAFLRSVKSTHQQIDNSTDVPIEALIMGIQVTETAARRIRLLMEKQGMTEGGLRVGVKGGGCSGLSYTFAWEREARMGDEVIAGPEDVKVFVDRKSLIYLNNTVLDYDTSLMSKGFVFQNPNAKSTCGCGTSFQV
jgi:iron-sulfur cluster assembly protein